MLRRKIEQTLQRWKRESHKAILLTGARQVGKSTVIRSFGQSSYTRYVEINLLLDQEARETIVGARSAVDLINRIALLSEQPLIEHNTLIFIDEIQEYPEIVTLIKGLVEDGRYAYAFSGSMLGTEFKGVSSFPVGFAEQHVMRPLDFEEFCWAIGIEQRFLDDARACMRERTPVDGYLHNVMLKNARAYMITGGMPEVVQAYIDSGYSLVRTRELQEELVRQYAIDIGRYAGSRALEARRIYDQIPVQLEVDPHRFVLASLGEGARFEAYDHDFLWLVYAGVGLLVPQATEAMSPLKRTERASKFKLYQSDTGMLVSRYPQATSRAIYLDQRRTSLGGIYENFVAQELAAHGVPLWYYQTESHGEVDFLLEGAHGVVPIEVKSGRKVRAHAALDNLLDIGEYKIREGIVLSRNNVERAGKVTYLPIYMVFCFDELAGEASDADDFTFSPVLPG